MAKRPAPPGGLAAAGQTFWKEIAWKYSLRPDELKILRDACVSIDLQAKLESDIAISPLKSEGSKDQEVINPAFTEWRQYSALVDRLLARLKLPDDASGGPNKQQAALSAARRAAVRSRHDRS